MSKPNNWQAWRRNLVALAGATAMALTGFSIVWLIAVQPPGIPTHAAFAIASAFGLAWLLIGFFGFRHYFWVKSLPETPFVKGWLFHQPGMAAFYDPNRNGFLDPPGAAHVPCPECAELVVPHAHVCKHCGRPLTSAFRRSVS